MLNKTTHQVHLRNILVNLYKDSLLANILLFRGGTAAYFFYDLPRFSTDLDFDLLLRDTRKQGIEDYVAEKVSSIIESLEYEVKESYNKQNTLFWLVSYGDKATNIKVEMSRRTLGWAAEDLPGFEGRNYYGESVLVTNVGDIIAQKLIALRSRRKLANRDLFDVHFFLNSKYVSEVNYEYLERHTGMGRREFFENLYDYLAKIKQSSKLMDGLGEVLNESQREWVKTKMLDELRGSVKLQMDLAKA